MSVNQNNFSSHGIMMLNSSPTEVLVSEEFLTFKMTSGIIEFYVFGGPRPNEVITQLQQTVGFPLLPPYDALNWQSSLITSDPKTDIKSYKDKLNDYNLNHSTPVTCKNILIIFINIYYYFILAFSIFCTREFTEEEEQTLQKLAKENQLINYNLFIKSSSTNLSALVKKGVEKDVFLRNPYTGGHITNNDNKGSYFVDYLNPNAASFIKELIMKYPVYYNEKDKSNTIVIDTTANTTINPTNTVDPTPKTPLRNLETTDLTQEVSNIHNYLTLYGNEPSLDCIQCMKPNAAGTKTFNITLPINVGEYPLEDNTLPLPTKQYGKDNNIMLNTHNLYPLQELKTYYTVLTDMGDRRPFIFSRSGFVGIQQYSGVWLGHFSGWAGLEMAIRNTIKFNVIINC